MITRDKLPENYAPYETLEICSNILHGGGHIVAVGNVLPLVIGKGSKPQIWLQAMNNAEKKEFVSIIESSVSKHPAVEIREDSGSLVITIQGQKVLVVSSHGENSASVSQIDLRPVGLNLYGTSSSLMAGGSTLSSNSMSGGGVLIGFGE